MDQTDAKILKILSENANTTATEIGDTVGLSVPAVNKRILKLQKDGTIKNFTIVTSAKKVNQPITAFILLVMRYSEAIGTLLEYMEQDGDILECYAVTGEYDYLIKICAEDVESLEEKLLKLKKHKGVVKSNTMFSLMEHKFKATMLPDADKMGDA